MASCKVFPEIYNINNELVESDLYKSLLSQGYSRAEATKLWDDTRSESFLKENGNWLLYKDLQSGRVKDINQFLTQEDANESLEKYNKLYGKDFVNQDIEYNGQAFIVKLLTVSSGDIQIPLDSNGEPQFFRKPDVILPIGTSGSGKSTFIKSLPQENLVIIEPDAMRIEFTGDINNKSKDKEIYEEAAKRAVIAIKQGKQVVFDTTNLTKDKRLPFIEAIKKEIPAANIQYKLMELNPELAKQRIKEQIARGEARANVPDSTIDRHAESYKQMLEDIKNEPITPFIDKPTVEFQRRVSTEEKFFKEKTGIVKNIGNANYRAKINKLVDNFNKKFGTKHYVDWKQQGQADLFKIENITWRWENFNPSQEVLFQKDVNSDSETSEVLTPLLELLSSQTNTSSELITEARAKELLGNAYNGEPAFFYDGRVYLVQGKASLESAFHEFSHPLINELYLTNRDLFEQLYLELESTAWGQAIILEVSSLYPNDGSDSNRKEAIVRALGRLGNENYNSDSQQSFLKRLLTALKRIINNVLGRKVNLIQLSPNTTLKEFSKMIGLSSTKKINTSKVLGKTLNNQIEYQKIDPKSELEKIINESELIVSKQIAIFKSRLPKGATNAQLKVLEEALDKIRDVSEVVDYLSAIEVVINSMEASEKKLLQIKNAPYDKKNAEFLKNIEEFLTSLEFIEDLSAILRTEKYESADKYMDIIKTAVQKRSDLLKIYKDVSLDYLSELLFNEIDPAILDESRERKKEMLAKNPNNARARLIITSKEEMREHLSQASKDISTQNLWLYSTAASNDPALSLGALYVKRKLEEAASDTILVAEQMNAALELYKSFRNKVSIDNPREFNDAITEIVEDILYVADPDTGITQPQIIQRYTLVNPFNITAFNRSYLAMKAKQDAEQDPVTRKKIFAQWASQNTEFVPNFRDIIAAKQAEFGIKSKAYHDWYHANILVFNNTMSPKFGGELWQPVKKFENDKWNNMSAEDKLYHGTMSRVLTEHQEKLPSSMTRKLKLANFNHTSIVPSRYKTTRERMLDKQYKKIGQDAKASLTINREREKEFGLVKLDGEPFYGIPIHHTQNMDIEDISPDVFTNILYFADSVNKRTRLQETEAEMLLLKDLLKSRDLEKVTQDGSTVYDIYRKSQRKSGAISNSRFRDIPEKTGKGGNSSQKFSEFIDVIYYGQSSLPAGNIFGKWSTNQLVNKVLGYIGLTQLAFNVPSAAANKVVGELSNLSNAFGGRYWSASDYAKATYEYDRKYIVSTIKDMAKGMPESLESRIIQVLDPIQGTFRDMTGRIIPQSGVLREFRRDHLFFLNNIGEHSIQVKNMIALLHSTKVTNTKTGEIKSLSDAIKGVNPDSSQFILEGGFEFSKEQTERLRNKLHRINQVLHGNYSNSIDMIMLQRRWYGKLALMFRKYIVPGMQRRWDVEHLDFETGEFEAGIYIDAYQHFVNKVVAKIRYKGKALAMAKPVSNKVELRQRAALIQTLFEGTMFLTALLIGNLMIDEDDNEKDSWAAYQIALLMRRVRGDLMFYINPLDFINILKNPTVASNFTVDFIKFVLGVVFLWGEDEYYDRNVGSFKKGDSKDWARFMKIVPLLRQVKNIQEPEQQMKFFSLMSI